MSKQIKIMAFAILLAVAAPIVPAQSNAAPQAQSSEIHNLKLVLSKLRESMAAAKDLGQLEEAGLPKKDVDRLRRAMESKIKQLVDNAITTIKRL